MRDEEEKPAARLDPLLERILREHASILGETKRFVEQIARDPSRSSVMALLAFYDAVVMEHARVEEEELVPIAREEGIALDGDALRFAHSILHEGADSLRNSFHQERVDRYIREAEELGRLLKDHFYEEENFLFETDPDEIRRNSGSY